MVEAKVVTQFDGVRLYFDRVFQRLDENMEGLRKVQKDIVKLDQDMGKLEQGLRSDMGNLEQGLRSEMGKLAADLTDVKQSQLWFVTVRKWVVGGVSLGASSVISQQFPVWFTELLNRVGRMKRVIVVER